jgi:hypothetical protein
MIMSEINLLSSAKARNKQIGTILTFSGKKLKYWLIFVYTYKTVLWKLPVMNQLGFGQ